MFGHKSPSKNQLEAWAAHLDTHLVDPQPDCEPGLEMAIRLQQYAVLKPVADSKFRRKLRARLVEEHPQNLSRWGRWQIALQTLVQKKFIPGVFAVATIAAILLWIGWFGPNIDGLTSPAGDPSHEQITPVDGIPVDRVPTPDMVPKSGYSEVEIDLLNGEEAHLGLKGSYWFASGGNQFRYEITTQTGERVHFEQGNQSSRWRSFEPVENNQWRPLDSVYEEPPELFSMSGRIPLDIGWLIDMEYGNLTEWPTLHRQLAQNRTHCTDVFCLLGMTSRGWNCTENSCQLFWNDKLTLEATLEKSEDLEDENIKEMTNDGRSLAAVTVRKPLAQLKWLRFYIDSDSLELVEVHQYLSRARVATLRPLYEQSLPQEALTGDFFNQLPEELAVQPLPENEEVGMAYLWYKPEFYFRSLLQMNDLEIDILSLSPQTGTHITQPTTIDVHFAYTITPDLPLQGITIETTLQPTGVDAWTQLQGTTKTHRPQTHRGQTSSSLTVSPHEARPGYWRLQFILFYEDDQFNGGHSLLDDTNHWYIDFKPFEEEMATSISIDKQHAIGSITRPQIVFAGRTTLPDETCIYTQLLADGEPVPWWPSDSCATLRDRGWRVGVPLLKQGGPETKLPEAVYQLQAWSTPDQSDLVIEDFEGLTVEPNREFPEGN